MNDKPLILFVGGIWLKEQEKEIMKKSKVSLQSAANVLQTNIIQGIDQNIGVPSTIVNAKFVGAFPMRYRDAYIKGGYFNHTQSANHIDYEIPFLNLPLIKHYSRALHAQRTIKKICKDKDRSIYVIGYSMTYSVIKTLSYVKKISSNIKTCLIVPDLPEYMNLGKVKERLLYRVIKQHNIKDNYKTIKTIDSFVILTRYMYEKLNVNAPYIVMEGIAPEINNLPAVTAKPNEDNEIKYIVYTGTLTIRYGILDLVNAFTSIKDDKLRLVICGAGEGAGYITKQAELDNRIIYLGIVSNEEARMWQQKAYILVNPRNSNEEYTKYSFPSKTLEYMTTGNPVLMYKLKGIPDCYDKYLFYVENNLKDSLNNILSLPKETLIKRGREGMEFVLNNKNKISQTSKIIDMLNNL